jgi:hypothetical protein
MWLSGAAIWSLGLVAAGLLVSSYSSTDGQGTTVGETLVQQNGAKVLLPLLVPLAGVVIVTFVLWRRRRSASFGVGVVIWVVFGLMTLLVVLGALTIGPFVAPVAVFVLGAILRVKGQSELVANTVP